MMKSSMIQPSLSRDFAILTGVILFALLLLSLWITWSTHGEQSESIVAQLEKETDRIERTLEREIFNASYLLNAIGRQIQTMDSPTPLNIAKILQAYQSHNRVYAIWTWTDETQSVAVSSNRGVLEEPVDVSDRDYVHKSSIDPWQLHIGSPIEGRVSDRWVIPVSLGVTDTTGRYLGSITASLDIQEISTEISDLVLRRGISFAILSKSWLKLTEVSPTPQFVETYFPRHLLELIQTSEETQGVVSYADLFSMSGIYAYYKVSSRYPYILLVGYDPQFSQDAIRYQLLPRLLQVISIAAFAVLFLWIVRVRILRPVIDITLRAGAVARGLPYVPPTSKAPMEINALEANLARMSQYIEERKRLETELREKLEAELSKQQKNSVDGQHFTTE